MFFERYHNNTKLRRCKNDVKSLKYSQTYDNGRHTRAVIARIRFSQFFVVLCVSTHACRVRSKRYRFDDSVSRRSPRLFRLPDQAKSIEGYIK